MSFELMNGVIWAPQSRMGITIGWTGSEPNRNSRSVNTANWIRVAFSTAFFFSKHLGAIRRRLNHANVASDMRIPRAANHMSERPGHEPACHLDERTPVAEEIAEFAEAWNGSAETFGGEWQAEHYRLGLGIAK